jgi:GT2 family glycosyltransferase
MPDSFGFVTRCEQFLVAPSDLDTNLATPAPARPRSKIRELHTAWMQSFLETGPIDVSVCIANWNCRDLLRSCLISLHDHPQGVRLETIVVDNGSTDGSADMVAHDFPEVILCRNVENQGFARANNQAAQLARGRYLFFLNNDTLVPALSLSRLVDYAESNPHVGLIGPRLRDHQGRTQVSYRQRPTMTALLHRTHLLRWTGLLRRPYRHYRRHHFDPECQRPVEVLMGAAMFLRRDVFYGCGGWDEDYVFGGEDIDLSTRIGRHFPIVYLPSVEITHYGRVSARQNVAFTSPNFSIGFARYLRKSGCSTPALLLYKAVVSLDAPVTLAAKSLQYLWRKARRRHAPAVRSLLAIRGQWHFLTKGLRSFWRV